MNSQTNPIPRRAWMLATAGGLLLPRISRGGDSTIDAIKAKGRKAGMQGFDESESANYRAIGDARTKFREEALAICEAVATDCRKHFGDKGFELTAPKEKLTVVTLMGPKSYAMFEETFIDQAIGGHFDLEANWLVMFDFAGTGANPNSQIPEKDNTLALVHEAVHQLTFNTGLLDLKTDTPLCIIEGLATYGETWGPKRRGLIGSRNDRRLKGLNDGLKQGGKWIPIAKLLADDAPLNDENTQQIAYAESWMLVSKLMKDPTKLPRFRDYLSALRKQPRPDKNPPDPQRRIALATEHLGDLEKLDKEVRALR